MKSFNINIPNFKLTARTAGNGLWSNEDRKIVHSKAYLSFFDREEVNNFKRGNFTNIPFADFRVFFPKRYWDVNKHGLIYTDRQWIKDLRQGLSTLGFSPKAVKDVDYSEQGMQGDSYVSLHAGKKFLKELSLQIRKNRTTK